MSALRETDLQAGNLFSDSASPQSGERFDTILHRRNLVIERILSSSAITPHDYVQSQDEWVLLVRGEATLRVEGKTVSLQEGDYLFLPAGLAHRVEAASDGALWLAVHLHPQDGILPDPIPRARE